MKKKFGKTMQPEDAIAILRDFKKYEKSEIRQAVSFVLDSPDITDEEIGTALSAAVDWLWEETSNELLNKALASLFDHKIFLFELIMTIPIGKLLNATSPAFFTLYEIPVSFLIK